MAWEERGGGGGGGEMRERKGGQEQAVQKGQAAGGIPGDLVQKAGNRARQKGTRHGCWTPSLSAPSIQEEGECM